MEYPIFDIPYQEAYTSTIEFNTQINEKMKGREQRYPVWTYPKRTFSLKFDKNFKGRKKLEEFFISVKGPAEKFYFTWEKPRAAMAKLIYAILILTVLSKTSMILDFQNPS